MRFDGNIAAILNVWPTRRSKVIECQGQWGWNHEYGDIWRGSTTTLGSHLVHTIRVKGTILIERPRSIIKIWSNYCSNDLNFVIWPVNDPKNRLNLTNIVMSLITNLISLLLTSRKYYVMLYTQGYSVYCINWEAKNGDHTEKNCFKQRNNRPEPKSYTLFFIFNKLFEIP